MLHDIKHQIMLNPLAALMTLVNFCIGYMMTGIALDASRGMNAMITGGDLVSVINTFITVFGGGFFTVLALYLKHRWDNPKKKK